MGQENASLNNNDNNVNSNVGMNVSMYLLSWGNVDDGDPPIVSTSLKLHLTTIIYGFICQPVVLFGCASNIVNMVVFVKMGFRDTINISLFALAMSDFCACFTLIWLNFSKVMWFQELDLPFDPNQMQYLISSWPHILFTRVTSFVTAFIMVERCLCVTAPLKVRTIITRRRVLLVIVTTCVLVLGSAVPIYYSNSYGWKFYPKLNKSLVGLVTRPDRQEIEAILGPIQLAVFAIFPFVVICVCTAILSISLKKKAAWRQTATTGTKAGELSSKETKIAKMLVFISALFIGCLTPNLLLAAWVAMDPDISIDGKEANFMVTLGGVAFTLESINSAMNIFIYHRNSSNYRGAFNAIFGREKKADIEIIKMRI